MPADPPNWRMSVTVSVRASSNGAMYTLHYHPASQHSRRVVALLEEAGIPYQLQRVSLETQEQHSDEFLGINPSGQVPVLVHNDTILPESNAILRFLCVRHELAHWYPKQSERRGQIEYWLDWNQGKLSPSVVDVVLNACFLGPKGDKAAIDRGCGHLPRLLLTIEKALQLSSYLTGDTPTIADLSVASNITHLRLAGLVAEPLQVTRWCNKICTIAGFKKTLLPGQQSEPEKAVTAMES